MEREKTTAEAAHDILATVTIDAGDPYTGRRHPSPANDTWHDCVTFPVTASRDGRPFWSGEYSFGVGHFLPQSGDPLPVRDHKLAQEMNRVRERRASGRAFMPVPISPELALHVATVRRAQPNAGDVLVSLLMDGGAYLDGETFEEWAQEYGYSSDSIRARELFYTCDEIGRRLARAFTAEELETLRAWAAER